MMPERWESTTPSRLFNLFSGYAFKSTDKTASGAKWLKIANVGIGAVKWDDDSYLPESYYELFNRFTLHKGDIVIALTRPTLGNKLKVARLQSESDKSLLNQRVAKVICAENTDAGFIYQVLRSDTFAYRINKALLGTDPPNLSMKVLQDFTILVPPFEEQKKIAQILSTWDKAITTTERLLANSQKQKKALMQQLLTGKKRLLDENGVRFSGEWKRMHFGEVVTLGKDKFDPKKENSLEECIELEHIEQNTSTVNGSTSTEEATSTKSKFEKNDILFGKLRPYLRKYWLADRAGVCSTEIWVFKTNSSFMLPEYLLQVVQLNSFIDVANKSSGTHMPRADWNVVKDFIIPVPSLSEQKVIADVLSSVQGQIHKLQKRVNILQEEKRALMQQLLTGKRRVKLDKEVA